MTGVIYKSATYIATTLFVFGISICMAQNAKFDLSNGNDSYNKNDYENALKSYSNALVTDPNYAPAEFNTANTYYRQEKMDEAIREFRRIAKTSESEKTQAKAYHNLGNAYLQKSKLKEAIEAYKNSLRLNPDDHETRYNLAFAQDKLKQNPEQQQQDQKQDQENKEKEDSEDQEKQDQQKENEEKNDNQDEKKPSDEDKEGDKNEEENEQPEGNPKEDEMSKEDAERLLQMLEDEEKETQEDLKKKKVKVKKGNIEKDW